MIESKSWNWAMVDKDDKYWNSPAPEFYYLADNWKNKNFKKILDVGCGYGRNSIYLAKQGFCLDGFDLSELSVERTKENVQNCKQEKIKTNVYSWIFNEMGISCEQNISIKMDFRIYR